MKTYFPGTRVLVFDGRLFKDDVSTPLSQTMRSATVKQWYSLWGGGSSPSSHIVDENLIDVEFDHRAGEVSRGHFAQHVEVLS